MTAADLDRATFPEAEHLKPVARDFLNTARLIKDGGSLTEKRREHLLLPTYALEEEINKIQSPHPALELYEQAEAAATRGVWLVMATILLFIVGAFLPVLAIGGVITLVFAVKAFQEKGKKRAALKEAALGMISPL